MSTQPSSAAVAEYSSTAPEKWFGSGTDSEPVVPKVEAVSQDEIDSLLQEALHAERAS